VGGADKGGAGDGGAGNVGAVALPTTTVALFDAAVPCAFVATTWT
jgi:hypothetical protein